MPPNDIHLYTQNTKKSNPNLKNPKKLQNQKPSKTVDGGKTLFIANVALF
jgi:hypothetical protein